MGPGIDHLVVTLVLSDEAHVIVVLDGANICSTALHDTLLFWRDDDVVKVERKTSNVSHAVTEVLDTVEELAGTCHTYSLDNVRDKSAQGLLRDDIVEEADLLRDNLIDDYTSYRCLDHTLLRLAVNEVVNDNLYLSVEITLAFVVCDECFLVAVECQTLALCARTDLCDIVKTEHHILRRHGDRSTVGRVQDVVALEHQYLCLKYSLVAEREVNSHLVTVEVGVERSTCKRVELDGFTLDKLRLERLDTETVKCRGTVEHDGMTLHYVLEDVPDNRLTAVNDLLGALYCLHDTALDELADDERLVKLGCHKLRQTALAHLELRTNDDNRTC